MVQSIIGEISIWEQSGREIFTGSITDNVLIGTKQNTGGQKLFVVGNTKIEGDVEITGTLNANVNANTINIIDTDTDNTFYLTFVDDSGNTKTLRCDKTTTPLSYNANTGMITSVGFIGSFIGNVNGNADTATQLETARTINGVSFNGTANIQTIIGGTNISIATNSTINLDNTLTGLTSITSTDFIGDLTGNATTATTSTTATTATLATTLTTTNTTSNTSYYLVFGSNSTTGANTIYTSANIHYNPSTDTLTVGNISATSLIASQLNITSDTTSSAPMYLCFTSSTGTQSVKIANLSGMVYYPNNNVYATLSQMSVGTVGFGGASLPQSGLYVSKQNLVDTFTNAGVHIGQDVANSYACIGLITSSATGVPYIKFAVSNTAYSGKIEYSCGNNQMNFYVNESATTVLELKANSVDVEETLNVKNTINVKSAGNTSYNWYENSTHKWTLSYSTTSNYLFLQDVVNGRDIIKCYDNQDVFINPSGGKVSMGTAVAPDVSLNIQNPINFKTEIHLRSTDQKLKMGAYWEGGVGQNSFIQSTTGSDVPNSLFLNKLGGYIGIGVGSGPYNHLDLGTTISSQKLAIYNNNWNTAAAAGFYGFGTGAATLDFHSNTASGGSPQMNLNSSGHLSITGYLDTDNGVGVGTAPTKGAIDVRLSKNDGSSATGYVFYWAGPIAGWSGAMGNIAIYTNGRMWVENYILSASDRRIKKNIVELVDNECLKKFRRLKPCKYNYVDEVLHQDKINYGLIADEVKEYFPEAVSMGKNHIPNIYNLCYYREGHLVFDEEIDIEEGIFNFRIINDTDHHIEINGEIVDKFSIKLLFKTDEEVKFKEDEKLFCYGYEVDDFKNVEYQAVNSLAYGALQEVDRVQQNNINRIQKLEEENLSQNQYIDLLESKISDLQNNIELIMQNLNLI